MQADQSWRDHRIHWRDRATWLGALTRWLKPRLRHGGFDELIGMGELDLCWDDFEWLDVLAARLSIGSLDDLADELVSALDPAVLRVYHGCRVADAGVFHRDGIMVNSPDVLAEDVRRIVAEEDKLNWLRPTLEAKLAAFEHRERDTGRLYVGIDDRALIEEAGHYCLYGSEWILSFLGWDAHDVLRRRGVPTLVEVDLPFRFASPGTRVEFAKQLLQEWTRVIVNKPDWSPVVDFTIFLRLSVRPEFVVGHRHPAEIIDPLHQRVRRRTETTHCPHCASQG